MYSTSARTWARSVAIDSAVVAALVAGVFYSAPYALQVAVFVLWWIAILELIANGMMALARVILKAAIGKTEAELELMKAIGGLQPAIDAKLKTLEKAKEGLKNLWSEKFIRRLAVSNTYLAYHWFSDAVVWILLVIANHPILASFKVFTFLLSCILIGVARKQYDERFAADDKIDEEMADHRKAVVQHNNVAGGDIAGGDIYK